MPKCQMIKQNMSMIERNKEKREQLRRVLVCACVYMGRRACMGEWVSTVVSGREGREGKVTKLAVGGPVV